jgi:putative membrane protein insertion efficiency factor
MPRALTFLIELYQRLLRPFFGANCRFAPTCSEYAHCAITRYGALKGTLLALRRLMRCHPFCSGGFDPVP